MLNIIQAKKVIRAGKQVGKITVKPVEFFYVEAQDNSHKYGLNVHASGKVEFFVDSMYADCTASCALVYKEMMQVAKAA